MSFGPLYERNPQATSREIAREAAQVNSRRTVWDDADAVFEHPQNGYQEAVPKLAWLWLICFGAFYLAYRQAWTHVILVVGIAFLAVELYPLLLWPVLILTHVGYAAYGRDVLATNYFRRGWLEIVRGGDGVSGSLAEDGEQ